MNIKDLLTFTPPNTETVFKIDLEENPSIDYDVRQEKKPTGPHQVSK